MNNYPRGVQKKRLKSGNERFVAQYTKNKHHYEKTFKTLDGAINQRKEWEQQHGETTWGNKPPVDLTGETYGELTVLNYAGTRDGYGALWECLCSCGNKIVARGDHLKTEKTKSCGHLFEDTITDTVKKARKVQENSKIDDVMLNRFTDKPPKNNTTGYRGVSKYKDKFRARLTVNGQDYVKGGFKTPKDAYYNGRLVLEGKYLPKNK